MRFASLPFVLLAVLPLRAQTTTAPAPAPPTSSALLRPGLNALEAGLEAVRTDRWKLPQAARDEVQGNLGSIHRDLETTLPPLVATADGKPTSVAAALPVSRNVAALYDVLLRIEERAKMAAPADQVVALEQARTALDASRRAFDDSLQTTATALEAQSRPVVAAPASSPVPCVPAPVKKKKAKTSQG